MILQNLRKFEATTLTLHDKENFLYQNLKEKYLEEVGGDILLVKKEIDNNQWKSIAALDHSSYLIIYLALKYEFLDEQKKIEALNLITKLINGIIFIDKKDGKYDGFLYPEILIERNYQRFSLQKLGNKKYYSIVENKQSSFDNYALVFWAYSMLVEMLDENDIKQKKLISKIEKHYNKMINHFIENDLSVINPREKLLENRKIKNDLVIIESAKIMANNDAIFELERLLEKHKTTAKQVKKSFNDSFPDIIKIYYLAKFSFNNLYKKILIEKTKYNKNNLLYYLLVQDIEPQRKHSKLIRNLLFSIPITINNETITENDNEFQIYKRNLYQNNWHENLVSFNKNIVEFSGLDFLLSFALQQNIRIENENK